jgi:predicted DNA-binding transcriptional regulator AlpA
MQQHEHSRAAVSRALLNISEVAQLLGVSERKVHALRAAGLLPEPVSLGPRALRWPVDELLDHVKRVAPRGGQQMPAHLRRLPVAVRIKGEPA